MRVSLSIMTAVVALATASSAQAQSLKPWMVPKGSTYYGSNGPSASVPATGLTQDLLVQSSNQLAASVVSQIVPGAIAMVPKSNANLPGYAGWQQTAMGFLSTKYNPVNPKFGFNPTGAASAGAGMSIGVLAGIALNPNNNPLGGAAIAAGSTAYGALLAHSWKGVPLDPRVLAAATGLAAAQTLAAGGAQWLLQDQPSATKAVGAGLATSGVTALIAAAAGSGPAAPAVLGAGLCATAICAASDAISGNWKPMGGAPQGVSPAPPPPPPPPTTNVIAPSLPAPLDPSANSAGTPPPGPLPPVALQSPADPDPGPASNSNQAPGQPPGSVGANTNTSGVTGQAGTDPTAPPTPGGGTSDPTGAPATTASNSNQSPGQQPAGDGGANNTSGTSQSGPGNNQTPPTPNPGPRAPTGTQGGAPGPAAGAPPVPTPIDVTKILEGIGGGTPQGTGPNVAGLQPPIQQPLPPATGEPPPPVTPPPSQPPVTPVGPAGAAPTPTPTGTAPNPTPTGAAAPTGTTKVLMLCYKPAGLDQLVCTSSDTPFCADGTRVISWSSRSDEEQCNGNVWTSSSTDQLCTEPPPGKNLSPEFCSPAECRPPGPNERSWQCTPSAGPPTTTASTPPPAPLPPVALQSRITPEPEQEPSPVFAPKPPTPVPPIHVATPDPAYVPNPPSVHKQPSVPSHATKPTRTKRVTKKRGGRGVATAPSRTRKPGRRARQQPRIDWGAVGTAIGTAIDATRSRGGHRGGGHGGGGGHHP